MSADIILFVPRSNPKADRAFWIGPVHPDKASMGDPGIVMTADGDLINIGSNLTFAEPEYVAPQNDPA